MFTYFALDKLFCHRRRVHVYCALKQELHNFYVDKSINDSSNLYFGVNFVEYIYWLSFFGIKYDSISAILILLCDVRS